jgi:hypothetical protein
LDDLYEEMGNGLISLLRAGHACDTFQRYVNQLRPRELGPAAAAAGWWIPPPPPLNESAPGPVALPKSLDTAIKLWFVAAGLSLLHSILSIVNTNALIDQTAANLGVSLDAAKSSVSGIGTVIFQLILMAVWLVIVWQMRAGQNWARIVLTVIGGIVVLFGVIGLLALGIFFAIGPLGVFEVLLQFASLAVIVAAIVFQFKPDVNSYFVRR